jgi:hypothetical protein
MKYRFLLLVFVLATLGAEELLCQSRQPPGPPPSAARASSGPSLADSFGVGVKVSTLGVGAEIAARVARRANVRAGFNILGYSRTFNKDGIPYDGHLDFRTVEGHLDVFPWTGNFHVSPGVLGYIGDPITAHASVPGGQSFTLGGVAYYSDATNPVTGGGKIDFNQAAPMVTVGWGNLIRTRCGLSRFAESDADAARQRLRSCGGELPHHCQRSDGAGQYPLRAKQAE